MPNDGDDHWFDALRTRRVRVDKIQRPKTIAEVSAIVTDAANKGLRVRSDAAGHSFSDIAVPVDVLIDPRHLKAISKVDATHVRVQGGVRLKELIAWLNERNLALGNLGSFDHQTIPGVSSTATHGSGYHLGGIPDMVSAIELVDSTGKFHRFTPADGDKFKAANCGLGALGLIVAVELQVIPGYYLRESAALADWNELKPSIQNGTLAQSARHVEVMVSPYLYKPTEGPYKNKTIRPALVLRKILSAVHHKQGERPFLPALALFFGDITAAIVLETLATKPSELAELHYDSCAESVEDNYNDRWDKVLLQDASGVPANSTEIGVPFENTVEAMDDVFAQAEQFKKVGWWHTSPLNLRFVAPSTSTLLAMYTDRRTTMIEIPQLLGVPGADPMYTRYERMLIQKYAARPHWGKVNHVIGQDVPLSQVYPKFPQWAAVFQELNAKRTFSNPMTARMGLDTLLP